MYLREHSWKGEEKSVTGLPRGNLRSVPGTVQLVFCRFPPCEDHPEVRQHFWNALLFSVTVSSEVGVLFRVLRQIVDSGLVGTALWF